MKRPTRGKRRHELEGKQGGDDRTAKKEGSDRLANPFERYRGALAPFPQGVKGIIAWVRELRGGEDVGSGVNLPPNQFPTQLFTGKRSWSLHSADHRFAMDTPVGMTEF